MENKKNNAVEKVEQTVNKNKARRKKASNKKSNVKRSSAKNKKRLDREEKLQLKEQKKQQKALQKEQARVERDKIRAEKRIELAKIRAHKKAEKEKAKASLARAKEAKRAEAVARREKIKAERDKRREMIRHETKSQREERIKQERRQKAQYRQQKLIAKRRERQLKREQKEREREKRRGFGGWLAAVISLGIATLVLASVLTFTLIMPSAESMMLENLYAKSFYETNEQINNIDVNMSKAIASNDKVALSTYLSNIAVESELAEDNISQLPLKDEHRFYTAKLINQIGDFSKHLNKKVVLGEKFTEKEEETLILLYNANKRLKEAFTNIEKDSNGEFNFSAIAKGNKNSFIVDNLETLENLSVDFPELIYDGPFSDGQDMRVIKGLNGVEISPAEAKDVFIKAFNNMNLKDVKNDGEASGGIESYNVSAEVNGDILYAQISKKGGKMLMFAYSGSCREVKFGEESAIKSAKEFMAKNDIVNMMPVWVNLTGNVYTINFAYSEGGVPVYSDLVKVRVCAETNMVIGLEAVSYYTNHTDRNLASPVLTQNQAKSKVSSKIEVESARLALIPFGFNSERLCYEFMGTYDDSTYYVYIDAENGRQIEMFKVISVNEGKLLI